MPKTGAIITVVVLAVLAFVVWEWRNSPLFSRLIGSSSEGQLIAEAHYQCDGGKTIDAAYYQGPAARQPQAGEPPVPTGSAKVALSDGRSMTLAQTISADGARYSNGNPQKEQGQAGAETFVFWSKGNGALVLENNEEKSYIGCIKVADDPGTLPRVYESGQNGFSIRYPDGYTVDDEYAYEALGPGKGIAGVKFAINPAVASGTNLSVDSYISVEQLASTTQCAADRFLEGAVASTLEEGVATYSYASSTGAGAGNRYEEQVFAIPATRPCIAVRYFIHYGAIENYPEGAVREFDRAALVSEFDAIRKTLTIVQ